MWYFISGFIIGGFVGLALFCILGVSREPDNEDIKKAYRQGCKDTLKKFRGLR